MEHRTVQDLMSHAVVHARLDTPFRAVAAMLTDNDITAVPVVDDRNCPIGMVSEADLLRHEAVLPDPEGHAPAPRLDPRERGRAEADTAGGLMSAPVITARPQWSVVEAARAMDDHKVKRLPVVDETGQLIGIISRSDLLRVFLRRDTAISEEITLDVLHRTLGVAPGAVDVTVADGVVTLRGKVGTKSLVPIAVRLCRAVDGVVTVHEELGFDVDDSEAGATEKPNAAGVIGSH
ncbi:CBS domain-containing protein [Streptomyces sp. AcE210]|uniref:CBS domain-containing protein n=1 Tax=Streptomyces sp. AcE210 TaxID=2292703 RepID=UPI000E300A46|nr:CBS domain-containing protein [Streptomyces sp. AcE210]RFC74531.1 CBS domain-containing protein [Streptomyces sp. AcE210]